MIEFFTLKLRLQLELYILGNRRFGQHGDVEYGGATVDIGVSKVPTINFPDQP